MRAILALDQGTTGSTALVIADDGRVLGRGYRELPQHFPEPGWVEHDAEDLFRTTIDAARDALGQAGVRPVGIGITNQRETVVAWERDTLTPLGRAIVWQDRRTAAACRALAPQEPMLRERTGLVADPYFSATKIAWRLEHDADLRRRAEAGDVVFGTVDAWLVARLTDGAVTATDHTNASRTLLYGLERGDWDDELLDLFGVPRHAMPEVRASSGDFGVATDEHLGFEVPVAGIAGDQQAALFGQGCWTAGDVKNTYGTGAFLLLHTGAQRAVSKSGLLTTRACGPDGGPAFALEGSIFIAGAAIQWLRDGLGLIASARDTEELARGITDTGGVFFVPALVGLGAPHWESEARGTLVGITRGTTGAHVVRAALEAMAFSTKEVLDAMVADAGVAPSALRVDGGAAANDWLLEFQANLLALPVERPDLLETTALGAALLAGLALGVWRDGGDALAGRHFDRFEPGGPGGDLEGWRRAVATTLFWARGSEHGGR
jgi:glycerol kinase